MMKILAILIPALIVSVSLFLLSYFEILMINMELIFAPLIVVILLGFGDNIILMLISNFVRIETIRYKAKQIELINTYLKQKST